MATDRMPAARRGRPAKDAPLYGDGGTLLLSADERAELNRENREFERAVLELERTIKSAVMRMYRMGELFDLMEGRDPSLTVVRTAEMTGIDRDRVSAAKRTWRKFQGRPEDLQGISAGEVMRMIAERPATAAPRDARQVQYAAPPCAGDGYVRESFAIAPLSGAPLVRYRIRADPQEGKFYLLQEGYGAALPIASLSVDEPRDAEQQAAFREMQDEIQRAMERYYAVIERGAQEAAYGPAD